MEEQTEVRESWSPAKRLAGLLSKGGRRKCLSTEPIIPRQSNKSKEKTLSNYRVFSLRKHGSAPIYYEWRWWDSNPCLRQVVLWACLTKPFIPMTYLLYHMIYKIYQSRVSCSHFTERLQPFDRRGDFTLSSRLCQFLTLVRHWHHFLQRHAHIYTNYITWSKKGNIPFYAFQITNFVINLT